jgi:hypothetical protein
LLIRVWLAQCRRGKVSSKHHCGGNGTCSNAQCTWSVCSQIGSIPIPRCFA